MEEATATEVSARGSAAGNRKIMPGAEPFVLDADGEVGCLLVHGFSSTPYDLRGLGKFLRERGIASAAPLLAGHGTHHRDLADACLADWLDSIREAYARIAHKKIVYAVGISFAGNMLLHLTQELRFDGLVLIGTPLYFRHMNRYYFSYRLLRLFGVKYQKKWYRSKLPAEVVRTRPNYDYLPLQCTSEVMKTVEWSRAALPSVRCPILIVQAQNDHVVDKRTEVSFRETASGPVDFYDAGNVYHVPLVVGGKEKVFAAIADFIQKNAR